jgi:SAM-dependent methyltransferase
MLNHCPACGGRDRQCLTQAKGLLLRECLTCGLVYSDPQPRERVRAKYLHGYDLAAYFGAMSARKRVLFERRLDRLGPPRPGHRRICDVGCADGQFLELASARGWGPYGVDLNPPAVERARERGATVAQTAIEEAEALPWGSFDVVTTWDAIEHTAEPRVFAAQLARLIAPGGRLMLTTLNWRSLVGRVFGRRWSMIVDDHFTYWDGSSLRRLVESVGLEVVDVTYFGLGRDFFAWADRLAARLAGAKQEPSGGPPRDWSAATPVLLAEELVNRVLNATKAGVGVELLAEKPPGQGCGSSLPDVG